MITVHASTITAVPSDMGYGAIVPNECVVFQEVNGEYELEMTHPMDEYGKWERLQNDRILYVPTPDGTQLFRIYRTRKNIKGEIEVKARHIFYDLLGNIVESLTITAEAGEAAVDAVLGATQYATTFTGSSDIATTSSAVYVRKNPVQILLGDDDNGWLTKWGGEIQRNNFSIAMNTSIGADNGRVVAYRKNLTGVDAQEDYTNVVTRIMPTGLNTDDTVLYLDPSKYVDSSHVNDYPHPRIKHVHFSDVKVTADGLYTSVAAARAELDARADALFALGCDLPEVSIDVEFQELGDTEEYQQYVNLGTIQLGDTVTVQHEGLGIDLDLRVVSYEWDALKGRHNSIRLGALRPNIGSSVVDIDIDLSALREDYSNAVKQGDTYNAVKIDHTDGLVITSTVDGVVTEVRASGDNGFELVADGVVVGKFAVVNELARLLTSVIASPNSPTDYISLEEDPDTSGRDAMRYFALNGSTWYEHLRIKRGLPNTDIVRLPPTAASSAQLILSTATGNGYGDGGTGRVSLLGQNGLYIASLYATDPTSTNYAEVKVTPTAIQILKNGVVVASW